MCGLMQVPVAVRPARATFWLAAMAVSLLAGIAQADKRGEQIMREMDHALTRARDQVLDFEMVIQQRDKKPRRIGLRVHVRGTEKRHIEFLYPGDVKGMKMLILAREQMYVYLPAFRKIRRIAGHVRAQTMFGADYNYDDLSTVTYSGVYAGRLVKQTETHWFIEAKRRPGKESPYAGLRVRVRKDNKLPELITYLSGEGTALKSEARSSFSCKAGMCNAAVMKMTDHRRGGHWTRMERKGWQVDSGFSERIFSLRRLQRAQ